MFRFVQLAAVACLLFCAGNSAAQSVDTEKEHAVIESGGAASHDITNGTSSFGPAAAIEVTPVKNWLELEFGTTGLFRRHSTEWGTDLLFKKPWDLSKKVEFMLGAGPEWVHSKQVDGGQSWIASTQPPHGYRSSVVYDGQAKVWIAVGPNGTDMSADGRNWRALLPSAAIHEPANADRGWDAISLPFVVGFGGRIGKLRPSALQPASNVGRSSSTEYSVVRGYDLQQIPRS